MVTASTKSRARKLSRRRRKSLRQTNSHAVDGREKSFAPETFSDFERQSLWRFLHKGARHLNWSLIAMMLGIKIMVLIFGAASYEALSNQTPAGAGNWLGIWNRWDALNYQSLAQNGYQATGEARFLIVFYPLYPLLVRLLALACGHYVLSAIIISGIASIIAGLLLQRLIELDHSSEMAQRAVFFLFIFPTSYFLHIGYTESLFLALALGCFLAARRKHWMMAGLLGALASLTRINGLILIPALAFEAFEQYRTTRRCERGWLWIGAVALGFGAYLLINLRVTGDAFAFLAFQREHWFKSLAPPWIGVRETINSTWWRSPAEAQMIGVQELLFVSLGLVCTVLCWRKLRPAYGVWMALNWLLVTSTSFILSVPRYTLIMFPIFMLFAQYGAHRFWNALIVTWSLLFLALFVCLFVQGRWAF